MVSPSFIYRQYNAVNTFSWGNVSIDIFINTVTEKRIFALSIIIYFYINKLYGIFIYIKINLTCTEKRIFAKVSLTPGDFPTPIGKSHPHWEFPLHLTPEGWWEIPPQNKCSLGKSHDQWEIPHHLTPNICGGKFHPHWGILHLLRLLGYYRL